jgi:hypothetical protein
VRAILGIAGMVACAVGMLWPFFKVLGWTEEWTGTLGLVRYPFALAAGFIGLAAALLIFGRWLPDWGGRTTK